jgi:NDP-sugar pyrophosphorylase family protein
MKAMIFAAGLGTRLQPLTDAIPKALVIVGGKTMLEHVIEKLICAGTRDIVVNVHHHAPVLKDFIQRLDYSGTRIRISDETDLLRDTGGGLWHARKFLKGDEPFIVYNVDVLCDINLHALLSAHQQSMALATLAVASRKTSRYVLVDNAARLSGWENTQTGETILCRDIPRDQLQRKAFSGIHVISPGIFELVQNQRVFPIMPEYLRLAKHHHIACFEHDTRFWADIGTPEKLHAAKALYETHPDRF